MPTQPSAPLRKGASPLAPLRRRRPPVVWLGLGVLVIVAAIVAIVASSQSDTKKTTVTNGGKGTKSTVALKEARPVVVTGKALSTFGEGTDHAVGRVAPELRGAGFDGKPVTVAHDGRPKLVLFVAHWCPHCQREVPEITEWIAAGGVPDGVDLYAVATSTDPSRPNYPPDEWLEREGWAVPTIDDQDQAVADAFGLTAFPYFVLVDSGGKVAERFTGEIGTDQLSERLAALGGRA